jgi:hypothetical protein
MMVFGIYLIFDPIIQIIGYIPLVGGIVGGVVGFAVFLAAMLLCLPLFLATVSIAWLFYRPLIGLILVVISGALAGIIIGINAAVSKN